jgi:DNA polymerase III subunit epsilon
MAGLVPVSARRNEHACKLIHMLSDISLNEGTFVAVDIETTGCLPGRNGIIELGAARIEAGVVVSTFSELVRAVEPIPYAVQTLTGISDRMVADAPPIEEVFPRFRKFAEGAVLIAHNYRFDLGFLDYHAEVDGGEPLPRPVLDTLALAKRMRPDLQKYNLGFLAGEFGVGDIPTHRADADAIATAGVFIAMLPTLAEEGLRTVGQAATWCRMGGQQSLAKKLVMTTGMPDEPGVYLLRDKRGRIIYVGRAKNIRVRARGYFYVNGDATGPRLGDETVSVGYVVCRSNLDAILLQSRLINRYRPKHNVTYQRGDFASLISVDIASRFPRFKIVDRPAKRGRNLGPFVNRWAVESLVEQLREVYGLRRCVARLGNEAPSKECEHRERDCPSPCVDGIDEETYRARLNEALEVFDRSGEEMRVRLEAMHDKAAHEHRHDDAIRYRDALKALDRSMAGLRVLDAATARPGLIIIEPEDGSVALLLVRYGYLAKPLRLSKADWGTPRFEATIRRSIHRAFYDGPYADNPVDYSPQQLKDVFLIENYRHQAAPLEIELGETEEETVAAVMTFLRRHLRVTRRRHVLTASV